MIRAHAALAIGVMLAAAAAPSQVRDTARGAAATASLAGRVFVAGTPAQPARRVRLTLTDTAHVLPGQTTTSDDNGAFAFRTVSPGRYELQAFKNGYLRSSYGASRPDRTGTPVVVKEHDAVTGLTMTIAHGGVITGVVRDARGRPLPGMNVRVLKLGYDAVTGEPSLSVPATSVVGPTDDRGEYRAFGLPPGGYIVMVNPSNGRSLGSGDDLREPGGTRVTFAPMFHPGASDVSAAATVPLAVGEERTGVDVIVQPLPTATVSGSISTSSGDLPSPPSIRLVPAGPRANLLAAAGVRAQSAQPHAGARYEIAGVAPGTYAVRASTGGGRGGRSGNPTDAPGLSAAVEIVVSGQDLEVPLTLQPDVPVRGRVIFDGPAPPAAELQKLSFSLVPLASGGVAQWSAGGRVDAAGRFAFAGVPPDSYRFVETWNSPGANEKWAITASTANGRDVLDSLLRVNSNEPVEWTIAYSSRPSVVRGVFADHSGRPATDYTVLIFPADRRFWTPGSRRVRLTRPATDGSFHVAGLPAGDYFIAALGDLEPGEWNDPTVLDSLVQWSIRIVVHDGETTTQDLRVGG